MAWGSSVMPTPSGLISGAASKTVHEIPRCFRPSANARPAMPPPMMITLMRLLSQPVRTGRDSDYFRLRDEKINDYWHHAQRFITGRLGQFCGCLRGKGSAENGTPP